jgi:hypothetical protein
LSFQAREEEIIRQLKLLVIAQGYTNALLSQLLKQEIQMATALETAFDAFDAEITTISNDIAELVRRLAAQPPGPSSDALAAEIQQHVLALKAAADPLKQIASPQATPTPSTPTPETPPTPPAPPTP